MPPRRSGEIRVARNIEVLRADEGEARRVRSSTGMQGRGKREIPEKTSRPRASRDEWSSIHYCATPRYSQADWHGLLPLMTSLPMCTLGAMERLHVGPGRSNTLPFVGTATENTLTGIVGESSTSEFTVHLLQPMQPLGWNEGTTLRSSSDSDIFDNSGADRTWKPDETATSEELDDTLHNADGFKSEWKRNVAKVKRNKGEAYINAKGTHINARSMKTGCEDKYRYQCSQIQDHKRSQTFEKYWSLGAVNRQRQYGLKKCSFSREQPIATCMSRSQPQYRRVKGAARDVNYEYHFEVDGLKYSVCEKFVMDTLNKTCDGVVEEDMHGKRGNHPTIDPTTSEDVRTHINSIPRIESHYLRKQTSREFISGGITVADLHRDYVKECQEQGRIHGTYAAYRNIFLAGFNISFFITNKYQCAFREKLKDAEDKELLANEYKEHRKEIGLSRTGKANDSDLAKQGKCVTACFDLQAVLPTPCDDVPAFYYKRRPSVQYFTIYDLGRNIVHCYGWHEGAGRRGPNDIASFCKNIVSENMFVFFSDNCASQNNNKFIVALYLYAVSVHDIAITEMDTQDFVDFKTLSKFYGTSFSVNTDKGKISWQSIREIKPLQFSYKTSFGGTSKTVLTRKVTRGRPSIPKLSHVYTSPPGATE
ncbi:hypothetical protein PR048_023030, partial [Dryococelus australis]